MSRSEPRHDRSCRRHEYVVHATDRPHGYRPWNALQSLPSADSMGRI
ncbi:hypothetical protein FRUB_07800 [Fimbriiglobus ruber]|uniref:Uncharacterized protein n=1 Tax=Fimbriiglobus ruber TaxID=1908690 RepID=A0A225DAS8_9BACT|nr:hypothetical protein FRUB_07800 [Fimbriiglobus ruber]